MRERQSFFIILAETSGFVNRENLGALPQTPAGHLVKASSLREDGFAAALILAVLIPLTRFAGAFAPAEEKIVLFGKIRPLAKGEDYDSHGTSGFSIHGKFAPTNA